MHANTEILHNGPSGKTGLAERNRQSKDQFTPRRKYPVRAVILVASLLPIAGMDSIRLGNAAVFCNLARDWHFRDATISRCCTGGDLPLAYASLSSCGA
jgi:hypothetical protein